MPGKLAAVQSVDGDQVKIIVEFLLVGELHAERTTFTFGDDFFIAEHRKTGLLIRQGNTVSDADRVSV